MHLPMNDSMKEKPEVGNRTSGRKVHMFSIIIGYEVRTHIEDHRCKDRKKAL